MSSQPLLLLKLDRRGKLLPDNADWWAALEIPALSLIVTPRPLIADRVPYVTAELAVRSCHVLNRDTWRMPTLRELQQVVDYTRINPAFGPGFEIDRGPIWTATPTKWCDEKRWCVEAYTGSTLYQEVSEIGHVLAFTDK